jgi:hypothetical protein
LAFYWQAIDNIEQVRSSFHEEHNSSFSIIIFKGNIYIDYQIINERPEGQLPFSFFSMIKKMFKGWGFSSVEECLSGKRKALSSVPITRKKKMFKIFLNVQS